MPESPSSLRLPPSGPWSGYYLYGHSDEEHHMRLGLTFTPHGTISGDGIDDIAPFTIRGSFDGVTSSVNWTKSYVGMHSVEYSGLYDGRSICGNWTLLMASGGFWIWPGSIETGEALEEELEEELEVPMDSLMKSS
jgi:hypothetical protein